MRRVALLFCAWILLGPARFEGDFHALQEYLLLDPKFDCTDAESLLLGCRDIAEQSDPKLAEFGALPLSALDTHLQEWVAKRRDV